jgi:hypothetical protein
VLVARHEQIDGHDIDLVIARGEAPVTRAFVNEIESHSGSHIDGLQRSLEPFTGAPIALLHLRTPDPMFHDRSRQHLSKPEVAELVHELITRA